MAIDVEVLLYALLVITVVDRLGSPYSLEKWLTEVLEEDQSYTDMGAAWKPAANRFPPRGTVNMLMGDAILIQSESELRDIAAVLRDYGGLPVAPCIVTLRNYNVSVKLGKVTGPQLNVKLKARPRHLSALVQIARLLRSKDGELRRALAAAGDVSMRVDTSPSKTELKRHCAALETDNKKLRRSKAAAASRSSAMRSTLSETKIEAREQGREEWCNNLEPALRAALDADVQLVRARELKNDGCKRARGAEAATAEATLRAENRQDEVCELREKFKEQADALAEMQQHQLTNAGAAAQLATIPSLRPRRGAGRGRGGQAWPPEMRLMVFEMLANGTRPSAVPANIISMASIMFPFLTDFVTPSVDCIRKWGFGLTLTLTPRRPRGARQLLVEQALGCNGGGAGQEAGGVHRRALLF